MISIGRRRSDCGNVGRAEWCRKIDGALSRAPWGFDTCARLDYTNPVPDRETPRGYTEPEAVTRAGELLRQSHSSTRPLSVNVAASVLAGRGRDALCRGEAAENPISSPTSRLS